LSIYRVIDKLEGYVREGTWLPLGHRILSEERLLEYIEKMRSTLPEEVGRAKVIATNKERVIRDAQEKAQQIVSEAASAQAQLIDQTDIVRQARTTAEVVLREAEEKARKIRQGADAYAGQVLADLEMRLSTALGSVKKGQEALVPRAEAAALAAPAGSGPLADVAAKSKRVAFDAASETAELESVEVAP
jgi:vacuolar-type H+-ATPase subunit H